MTSLDFEELRFVEEADVYKKGVLAGRLRRRRDHVEFAYHGAYLTDGGPAVATTMPVGRTALRTRSPGAVPPFFAGLLPEGRRLAALRQVVKSSADDDLTLLLAVGGDTVGDVQVLPAGTAPAEVAPLVAVQAWEDVRFADLVAASVGTAVDRVALPGVQDKVSARVLALPVAQRDARYILKIEPPDYPHLVVNEAFFLGAARESGLAAAEASVVHDADGVAGLLVRRFDREVTPAGEVVMRAQEDGCQVLDRYPADKYRLTTEEVVAGLASVTAARPVAARDLVRQVAFAYLTGNGDAHAKNLSILERDGEWRAAPLYDAPSSYPYGDVTMALTIGGRRREDITRASFLALGEAVGLRPRAVERALDDLLARSHPWVERLDELPFDRRLLTKLRRAIEYRRARLTG